MLLSCEGRALVEICDVAGEVVEQPGSDVSVSLTGVSVGSTVKAFETFLSKSAYITVMKTAVI